MNNHNIGANIAELRKEKGITQETLADAVGVTGQSVSKWEGGGSPDTMLLPAIADYFGVSIDRLFGRKTKDATSLEEGIIESISSLPEEKRISKIFSFCRQFIVGVSGGVLTMEMFDHMYKEIRSKVKEEGAEINYGRVETIEGAASIGFDEDLQYFMIMPEPEKGWGQKLHFKEKYVQLFKLLSDADALRLLLYLYQREGETAFTSKLIQKKLAIPLEKAEEILQALKGYELVTTSEVEMDDAIVATYQAMPILAFIPFLIFTDVMCSNANPQMQFCMTERKRPYLYEAKEGETE